MKEKQKNDLDGSLKYRNKRAFNIFVGILIILLSSPLYFVDVFTLSYKRRVYEYAEPYNYIFAFVLDVYGVYLIVSSFIFGESKYRPTEEQICSQCLRTYTADRVPDWKCPECGGETENIRGFYERHPELRDKEEIPPPEL